jgi:hypothetical protein
MNKLILFQEAIPGVVSNNPSDKPFNEDRDALILDPHKQHVIACHFVLRGRMVVSPQTILTEKRLT